jgi:hypothetical protein
MFALDLWTFAAKGETRTTKPSLSFIALVHSPLRGNNQTSKHSIVKERCLSHWFYPASQALAFTCQRWLRFISLPLAENTHSISHPVSKVKGVSKYFSEKFWDDLFPSRSSHLPCFPMSILNFSSLQMMVDLFFLFHFASFSSAGRITRRSALPNKMDPFSAPQTWDAE